MVSHKANATRKRSNTIVMHGNDQFVTINQSANISDKENYGISVNLYFISV
jgi:GTPase Era involved in 16S rRNA processing